MHFNENYAKQFGPWLLPTEELLSYYVCLQANPLEVRRLTCQQPPCLPIPQSKCQPLECLGRWAIVIEKKLHPCRGSLLIPHLLFVTWDDIANKAISGYSYPSFFHGTIFNIVYIGC